MKRSRDAVDSFENVHRRPVSGIVSRIRLENFTCHSNLQIELGNWVNFITGQNGSGKSAILTALCIAFGIRARSTQRASTLKDFIKNGCSLAVVVVELKNHGEDAFKKEIYGNLIVLERRITESSSTTTLKDCQGYFQAPYQACQKALELRWNKFERNATLLKRRLTWQFNGHLRKKGCSGHIKINYEDKSLSIEVKMPQDASSNAVRDTRGLSGGERSFSTLCFALALHEMTEAPFRAMDEFDVFMDAVSRKISLDTVVEFAVAQGSQWIFITPHDISMVKAGDKVKKQQMAAPRS